MKVEESGEMRLLYTAVLSFLFPILSFFWMMFPNCAYHCFFSRFFFFFHKLVCAICHVMGSASCIWQLWMTKHSSEPFVELKSIYASSTVNLFLHKQIFCLLAFFFLLLLAKCFYNIAKYSFFIIISILEKQFLLMWYVLGYKHYDDKKFSVSVCAHRKITLYYKKTVGLSHFGSHAFSCIVMKENYFRLLTKARFQFNIYFYFSSPHWWLFILFMPLRTLPLQIRWH